VKLSTIQIRSETSAFPSGAVAKQAKNRIRGRTRDYHLTVSGTSLVVLICGPNALWSTLLNHCVSYEIIGIEENILIINFQSVDILVVRNPTFVSGTFRNLG
jgi:hypothetical protein